MRQLDILVLKMITRDAYYYAPVSIGGDCDCASGDGDGDCSVTPSRALAGAAVVFFSAIFRGDFDYVGSACWSERLEDGGGFAADFIWAGAGGVRRWGRGCRGRSC